MKKLNDKKISVLAATALTVSLVMPTVQMIPAEETEVLDQYMIIELEPLAKPEVDVQETENSSEEQSTEEFSEVVSESDTGVNVLANAEISNLLPIQHTSQILLDPLAVILACGAAGRFVPPWMPCAAAKNIPVLFVHGDADDFVPVAMPRKRSFFLPLPNSAIFSPFSPSFSAP